MKESPPRRRPLLTLGALLLTAVVAYRSVPPAQAPALPVSRRPAVAVPAPEPLAANPAQTAPAAADVPLAADQFLAFVQPADAASLSASLRAPAADVRYVRINRELIEGKQSPFWQPRDTGRLELPLPDGGTATVVIQDSESLGARRFTSVGKIEGRPDSRAVFAYNEGFLSAHLEDPALGEYQLRAATEELEQYYKVDPSLLKRNASDEVRLVLDAASVADLAQRKLEREQSAARPDTMMDPGAAIEAASAGRNVEVHLLMLYTQGVRSNLSGAFRTAAIQSDFDNAVALLNSDLQASLCLTRVRLVRIAQTTYADDNLNSSVAGLEQSMLIRLASSTDSIMDEIHALRDQVGADLVSLVHHRPDRDSVGLAYRFPVDEFGSVDNSFGGFSVVDFFYLTAGHTFSHEIGHNLGNTHNREDSSGQGAFSYSYGYRYTAASGVKYRDIMSYDSEPASYTFLPYFSTPLVTPTQTPGRPIGLAAGSSGESDCARSIDQVAFEVSAFRLQMQAPATNGTLYAVSTRAFVGPAAEQQLIGAFIISGPTGSTKRMLIRGNGPALAASVPNFLPNPKITLFRVDVSPSVVVAVNDDWSTNPNAGAIATAGGTSAAANSLDAALLIDLAPGIYTANVTSSDGRTGVSLVEAYEVTTAGTKVTALSTRGYSSTDQIMIAGFIVNGTAGTTKRIVIRGQGPSLARQGVAGAMDDPALELYNSSGDRIMLNDDWALSRTAGDDFRPLAVVYPELQLVAANMAPANRREPCIMVDLPPGLYTAFLKPYQDLTVTPQQVAQPGIALVEVYEIP